MSGDLVRLRLPDVAFVLGPCFLLFGLLFWVVGGVGQTLSFGLDSVGDLPGQPTPFPLRTVGAVGAALVGVVVIVARLTSSLRVTAAGVLVARSFPPFVDRRVDLTSLQSMTARRGPKRVNNIQANQATAVLTLTDATGARVSVNPLLWGRPQPLLHLLHDVAVRSGALVDDEARAHLDPERLARYRTR